jgi:hypothetical protein
MELPSRQPSAEPIEPALDNNGNSPSRESIGSESWASVCLPSCES